jgi:acetylornithine aminotransferase
VAQLVGTRPRLLTMSDSYFGAYGSAQRRLAAEWFSFDWMECAGCAHEREDGPGCEHWAAIPWDDIGGFLFEPGSSSGLVRFPPHALVRNVVREIRRAGGLVLVNEVTTGAGRTGEWFGHRHYGMAPDFVAMGKGIGNGYPVSVAAFAPVVLERLGDRVVRYAQSHQNDPPGAAVVREVIRVIEEEGLIARGRALGERLLAGLRRIQERTAIIREVRARGLMVAVELEDDPREARTTRIHHELVRRGYIVGRRPGVHVLRIDPSLTVEREDIDGFLATFASVLEAGLPPA